MSEALLTLRDVSAWYGHVQALREVDLTVRSGTVVALLGANGAGKTTTIRSVTAAVRRTGSIHFDGRDITRLPTHRIARAGIGTVPADRGTITDLTVAENLDVGATALKDQRHRARRRGYVFDLFPILADMVDRPAGLLSGGQQQMLAIGRALMSDPRLLVLDEPSQGLAPIIASEILTTIRELTRTAGLSVLISEQNATAALKVADDVVLLANGIVFSTGDAATVTSSSDLQAAYLGSTDHRGAQA